MPSAVPATVTKQASSTTMSASESTTAAPTDAPTAIAQMMEKKLRNLEKRKGRLDMYEQELKKGKELSKEKMEAVEHLGEVEQQMEWMKDLIKNVNETVVQYNKQKKAEKKAEKAERVQVEISRLRDLLSIQDSLSTLGNETVRKDFINGTNGAAKMTEEELDKLDELYRKVCPCHEDLDEGQSWQPVLQESAGITYSLLTKSTNPVPFYKGKTYADLLALIHTTYDYFDSKSGRSQSPEQAKSEAASTISNVEDNARVVDKGNENQPPLSGPGGQHPVESANVPNAFNGGNAPTSVAGAHLPPSSVVGSITPPRKSSPSDLIGQSNQANISFLQEDQSTTAAAFGGNNTTFENPSLNALPYNEPVAFQYAATDPASIMYQQQQQPIVSSSQRGGYSLTFDSTASGQMNIGDGGNNEQMIPMKPLDPNAPTFVSQSENVYAAPTRVSVSSQSQMQQDSNQSQYFAPTDVDEQQQQRMPQQINVENVPDETAHGGLPQEGQGQQFGRGGGGGRGGGRGGRGGGGGGGGYRGGERGGERGGGFGGRGRGAGYGYRGGPGGWGGGYDGGYRGGRGGGGGYRGGGGGYRNDDPGRGGRGGGGAGGFSRRGGGGGFEPRGGRGGGGQPRGGGGGFQSVGTDTM